MKTESEAALGKCILLVDDERVVRESVRTLLAKDHHIVVEANNGAEAFGMFTKGRFDLVMTDYLMPFLSGDELAARIKRLAPEQPILMITGQEYKRSPKSPVNAVLAKPFDYKSLHEELVKLLCARQ